MSKPAAKLPPQFQLLEDWAFSPERFVEEALGATPAKWQREALQALASEDRIAVRSGNGVGKTTFLSWAILWFLLTRFPVVIPCTAPSEAQLTGSLWREIRKWKAKLPKPLANLIEVSEEKVSFTDRRGESFAIARTSRKENPEALQGFHEDNLLFIIDEASGVDDMIFQVAQGSLSTPFAKILMTGNPTRTSGYFYNAFHASRDLWRTFKVSIFDCADMPYMDAERQAKDIADSWGGENSPQYQIRALGEFPSGQDNAVIPIYLLEAAVGRDVKRHGLYVWGVDVARFGDDRSALAKRQGNHLIEPVKWWRGKDLMQTAGLIALEYEEARVKPEVIYIDTIGLGAGVKDRLKEQGLPVRGINVAESASIKERYMRLRDELWFRGFEWFNSKEVVIPNQPALIAELSAPTYEVTSTGKVKVESKDEIKERLPFSPDLADAFLLTFAAPKRTGKMKPLEAVKTKLRQFV